MSLMQNALYLAWSDTKARYKKSVLGPLWPMLTNLIGIIGLSLVWSSLMGQNMSIFVPQLAIGLIIWQLISGVITDSPVAFVRQASLIKNVSIPIWFFAFRMLARHIINLMHNAIIIVGIVLYYSLPINSNLWMLLPSIALVIANLYWMIIIIGLVSARFRDIEHLILTIMPMIFFVSPVLYRADKIQIGLNIVWLNPFSYMIEAIRSPILGISPHPYTYPLLFALLIVGGGVAIWYQSAKGRQIAFWV
jgi:ABC-type polysaccharide/polyol phosphate export permease